MRRGVSILVLLLFLSSSAIGGFERKALGTRGFSVSGAACALGEDGWGFYYNPARMVNQQEINLFFLPSYYGIKGLKLIGASYRGHIFFSDIGAGIHTFGFELYRETTISLNFSRPVYDFLFVGGNINLNNLWIKDYGDESCVTLDLGLKFLVSEHFVFGLTTTNVNSGSMTQSNDRLPQILDVALGYIDRDLLVEAGYFKELGYAPGIQLSAEYNAGSNLFLRVGATSGTQTVNGGFELRVFGIGVGYSMSYHQTLGITHSFGLRLSPTDLILNKKLDTPSEYDLLISYIRSLKKNN
ncbi:MAG: hypothetical protein ACP5US_00650 [Candidatus Kryptoniota bacterium]